MNGHPGCSSWRLDWAAQGIDVHSRNWCASSRTADSILPRQPISAKHHSTACRIGHCHGSTCLPQQLLVTAPADRSPTLARHV